MQEFIERINQIQSAEAFNDEDLSQEHPFCTAIHRQVEGAKANLPSARSGAEFTRERENDSIYVSMRQGMSCSTTCYYGYQVRNGTIPLEYLPPDLYEVKGDDVCLIKGLEYTLVHCYHRQIPKYGGATVTVSEAVNALGNYDACMLDDNFAVYFDKTDHGLIKLRNRTKQDNSNFTFSSNRQVVTFSAPFFDLDSWIKCNTLLVKIPIAVISLILSGKDIEKEKEKLSSDHRSVLEGLESAFNIADVDKVEDSSISILFASTSLGSVRYVDRLKMVDILDEFACYIWGDENTTYLNDLRPLLLLQQVNDTDRPFG